MFVTNRHIRALILLSFPLLVVCLWANMASAMRISPPRIVIEAGDKVAHVYLKNDSDHAESYRFRWKHLAMDKEGNLKNLDIVDANEVPDFRSADEFIRFSPRRTLLQAGESQRITFLVRRPPGLADGEYRSHFVVDNVPLTAAEGADSANAATGEQDSTAGVGVGISLSRAFPVYFLHGNIHASLKIDSATLRLDRDKKDKDQATHIVDLNLSKEGNRSIIGRARVFCGDEPIMPSSLLFAIYAEADRRQEEVYVTPALAKKGCRDMRVVIKGAPDDQLAGQILAEHRVQQ